MVTSVVESENRHRLPLPPLHPESSPTYSPTNTTMLTPAQSNSTNLHSNSHYAVGMGCRNCQLKFTRMDQAMGFVCFLVQLRRRIVSLSLVQGSFDRSTCASLLGMCMWSRCYYSRHTETRFFCRGGYTGSDGVSDVRSRAHVLPVIATEHVHGAVTHQLLAHLKKRGDRSCTEQ